MEAGVNCGCDAAVRRASSLGVRPHSSKKEEAAERTNVMSKDWACVSSAVTAAAAAAARCKDKTLRMASTQLSKNTAPSVGRSVPASRATNASFGLPTPLMIELRVAARLPLLLLWAPWLLPLLVASGETRLAKWRKGGSMNTSIMLSASRWVNVAVETPSTPGKPNAVMAAGVVRFVAL
eukprot:scaffold77482_cov27-Tisochrysis_lutea.AAC.3